MKKTLFLIVIMLISIEMSGQILYNIEKPFSYKKSNLELMTDLPNINFPVLDDGRLNESNINTDVKDYALVEKVGNNNIARVRVSVAARKLGEISVRFSNVILNNGAYCYVYTNDYQVVAGPIYQNSINSNLNIVKIPAKELILEVVYSDKADYDMTLKLVSYEPAAKEDKKNNMSLLSTLDPATYCSSSNVGEVGYWDDIQEDGDSLYKCGWFTEHQDDLLFELSTLHSINDLNLPISRAACMIIGWEQNQIKGKPGTLMNFPDSGDCGASFIFQVYHVGLVQGLNIATKYIYNGSDDIPEDANSQVILDNTIIRFNWHHKYGTPWHLEGLDCDANATNFELWRKTIDFDEVIDYCGVTAFAYSKNDINNGKFDMTILKMQQTPFYKEYHLGWTTERYLDETDPNKYIGMGRKGNSPTLAFTSVGVNIGGFAGDPTSVGPVYRNSGMPTYNSLDGFSGSQILYYSENVSEYLGIALFQRTALNNNPDYYSGYHYDYVFNSGKFNIFNQTPYLVDANLYTDYLEDYIIGSQLFVQNAGAYNEYYYMPSVENREKCPSQLGGNCEFNFVAEAVTLYGGLKVNINLDSLSCSAFPGNVCPKGLRIYHKLSDQATFYFDSFSDGYMEKNISFPIDKCDLFYYRNMGLDTIELGFDFYDEYGKVLNQCEYTAIVTYDSLPLCNFFDVTTKRITDATDTCCAYSVAINFEPCDNYSNIIYEMVNSLQVKNQTTGIIAPLQAQTDMNADYLNGNITFTIEDVCETTDFELIASSWADSCNSQEFTLDCIIPEPACDSCEAITADIKHFYGIQIVNDGSMGELGGTTSVQGTHTVAGYIFFNSLLACPGSSFDNVSVHVQGPDNFDAWFTAADIKKAGNHLGYIEFGIEKTIGHHCYTITTITPLGICVNEVCYDYYE